MQVAIVGSGYVGLVAGACFADLGHQVIVVDNDQAKLAALNKGEVPIHEKFLPELLKRHRGHNLKFSDDLPEAVRASRAIFIAVGTPPTEQGEADLSYVESVARSVSGAINGYKVIVEKSTVPVYTSDWVRKIILRNAAPPDSFDIASNPEFLREGTAVTDFLYPDRIVVGADNERCASVLREIYAPLTDGSYYTKKDAIPAPDRAQIPPPLMFLRFRFQRFPHRARARLRRQDSFHRRPGVGAVPDGAFQRPRQVIAVVGGQQAQHARGLVFAAAAGADQFVEKQHAIRRRTRRSAPSAVRISDGDRVPEHVPADCASLR